MTKSKGKSEQKTAEQIRKKKGYQSTQTPLLYKEFKVKPVVPMKEFLKSMRVLMKPQTQSSEQRTSSLPKQRSIRAANNTSEGANAHHSQSRHNGVKRTLTLSNSPKTAHGPRDHGPLNPGNKTLQGLVLE